MYCFTFAGKKNELAVKFYPAVAELSGDVMVYQGMFVSIRRLAAYTTSGL